MESLSLDFYKYANSCRIVLPLVFSKFSIDGNYYNY